MNNKNYYGGRHQCGQSDNSTRRLYTEKMKKFYLIGAGNVGRSILEIFPYGYIIGVMDSNDKKVGDKFGSFSVEKTDLDYLKNNNLNVILSFYDEILIDELEKRGVEWFVTWGKRKNIFKNKKISEIIVEDLKTKLLYDHRLINDIIDDGDYTQFMWRKTFRSDSNRDIVSVMQCGDVDKVSEWSNNYYGKLEREGMTEDEIFENRVGLCLTEKYIVERLGIDKIILDIGCGHGDFIKHLISKGINATGIDSSIDRVNCLKAQGIDVSYGIAENTEKPDEKYDCVTCFECLEHVMNPISVIDEMYRIMKIEGQLIISVPYKKRLDCDTHVRFFDENSVALLLKDKFKIDNIILIPYLFGNGYNNMFIVARKGR